MEAKLSEDEEAAAVTRVLQSLSVKRLRKDPRFLDLPDYDFALLYAQLTSHENNAGLRALEDRFFDVWTLHQHDRYQLPAEAQEGLQDYLFAAPHIFPMDDASNKTLVAVVGEVERRRRLRIKSSANNKGYYRANYARLAKKNRDWFAKHPEKKALYLQNRKEKYATDDDYRAHRKAASARNAQRRRDLGLDREYRRANAAEIAQKQKEWWARNPEKKATYLENAKVKYAEDEVYREKKQESARMTYYKAKDEAMPDSKQVYNFKPPTIDEETGEEVQQKWTGAERGRNAYWRAKGADTPAEKRSYVPKEEQTEEYKQELKERHAEAKRLKAWREKGNSGPLPPKRPRKSKK